MPDLNSLAIFAKVVEAHSFAEASRRLQIPIATVSRRIAELEEKLGFRLLDRSTRNLKLTDVGSEIFRLAKESLEVSDAVDSIVSNKLTEVAGILRLSAPPNIAETVVSPILSAFQSSYPEVSVQLLVTERFVDLIVEEIDVAFRVGALKDSTLVAKKLISYRQQLVCAPEYLQHSRPIIAPDDLKNHRVIAFSHWSSDCTWEFTSADGQEKQAVAFQPFISFNDFSGIAEYVLEGECVGHLPPIVRPDLLLHGRLVEVMQEWHFPVQDLSLVHLGNRNIARPVRLFKELATQMAPVLFPDLPA